MTWTKLDDGIFDHPKMLRAGEDAANLYVRALVYCNKHLTDGRIFPEVLATLTRRRDVVALAQRLVEVGAWESHPDGGWLVHDFHAHNPTAEEVTARRAEISRKRAEAGKRGGIASAAARSNEATPKQPDEANGKPRPDPSRPSVEGAIAPSAGEDALASSADPRADAIARIISASSVLRRGVADPYAEALVIVARHGDAPDLLGIVDRARDYLAAKPKRMPSNGADFLRGYILKALNPKEQPTDDADHAHGSRESRIAAAITSAPRLHAITPRPNAFAAAAVKAYPAVDIPAEIARAAAWLVENPANAKSNGARFLGNWLRRAQERAPRVSGNGPALAPVATREEIAERLPVTPNRIIKGGLFGGR